MARQAADRGAAGDSGRYVAGDPRRGVRLIVNELPYTGPVQAGQTITGIEADPASGQPVPQFAPVAPGPQSFVLADRLAFCRFLYLQPLPELRSSSGGPTG